MVALAGIVGLLVFIYARPHELVPGLQEYNLLYLWLALAVLGIVADVARRRVRLVATPMLPYVIALWAWCLFTLAVRDGSAVAERCVGISVCVALYVVLASPSQSVATYARITLVVFSLGLFVAGVGADQGTRPFQCVVDLPGAQGAVRLPDGRACENVEADGAPRAGFLDCVATGQPGVSYACERVGLFDTTSVSGRVRYLGVLADPNDLALATAMSLPFAFAFWKARRSAARLLLLLAGVLVIAVEIVFTQSRGGQLTFAAVLGTYFVEKYGWRRGVLAGAALGVPVLLLGGRSDASADSSTIERLGCACAAIKMLLSSPLLGVGYTEFGEHHGQTAHNAYLLAAGELGAPGALLFAFIVYLAVKVPVTILRMETGDDAESRTVRALAMAVLASFAGGAVGMFFLSWTYHYVLWIHLGLSGGLHALATRRHPAYACRLTLREAAWIAFAFAAMLAVFAQYIRWKGAWE